MTTWWTGTRLPVRLPVNRFWSHPAGTVRAVEWTSAQRQVLAHQAGWLQVRGWAGSGKTTVLVERWRRRAAASDRPERTLVLCRSRGAADDFRRAVLRERSWATEGLAFTTFYGAAFDLVSRHRGASRLLTRAEQWTVVRRMLAEDQVASWPSCPDFVRRAAFVDEVATALLVVEGAGVGDDAVRAVAQACGQGERWEDLLAFRHRYRRVTAAMGALDGAQLFTEANEVLCDGQVAEAESARWDEVLIDDADAVTAPMGRLVELLAPSRLVATGDDAWEAAGDVAAGVGAAGVGAGVESAGVGAAGVESAGVGAAGVESAGVGAGVVAPARWFQAYAWPATLRLSTRHRTPKAPTLVRCGHPTTEPEAVAGVLLKAHDDGVPWREMAVLTRSDRERAASIGRALRRHGIPVRLTPGSLAGEPAVRAVTDFFAWVGGDEEARDRLLVSPAVDLGPVELRQLRREVGHGGTSLHDHPRMVQLAALRDAMAPRLESDDPAQLAHEAWSVLLGALVPDPDADTLDVTGARAMAAVAAFLAGVSHRAAQDSQWRMADELAMVEGPDYDPDPWVPAPQHDDEELVDLSTIWAAGGRAWDTVVVAGCLEGELPRGSGAVRFFDRAVVERAVAQRAGGAGRAEASAALPTLAERRRASLDEERRLFAVAASRARRRLVAVAAPAPGQLVSRFVADATPESHLVAPRVAVGALGLRPAGETEGPTPVHLDGRLRLSATRLMTYADCPLRYFYQYTLGVRGAGGVAASMGTVVHAALAAYLDPDRSGERSWPALEALAQSLWWDAGWSETIAAYQPLREQARRDIFTMLHDWWQAEAERAEASGAWPDVVAVEYPFDFVVGGHRVRGSIDRVDRVPGGIAIVDYKTGSKVLRAEEVAEDLQLATYHLAAVRDTVLATVGPPVSLQLCYLRSGARPSQPIPADHASHTEQRIMDVANRILREEFEPSVEADCDYCDFWRLCPLQVQGRQVVGE